MSEIILDGAARTVDISTLRMTHFNSVAKPSAKITFRAVHKGFALASGLFCT